MLCLSSGVRAVFVCMWCCRCGVMCLFLSRVVACHFCCHDTTSVFAVVAVHVLLLLLLFACLVVCLTILAIVVTSMLFGSCIVICRMHIRVQRMDSCIFSIHCSW